MFILTITEDYETYESCDWIDMDYEEYQKFQQMNKEPKVLKEDKSFDVKFW